VNQVPSFGNGLGLSHSESGWHRERLEMEIIMTRCFVELVSRLVWYCLACLILKDSVARR
jgi:hypothetical protein